MIAFCSFVGEGAASDWSAVYMTQELGTTDAVGAVAFAAFAVTMALARFATDPLRTRFDNVVLVRGGALIAAAGLGLALLVHEPAAGSRASRCWASAWPPWCRSPSAPPASSTRARPAASWAAWRRSATWAP